MTDALPLFVQIVVPLALVAWVGRGGRRTWIAWGLDAALAIAFLGALGLAALWLAVPRAALWICGGLLAGAVLLGARRLEPGKPTAPGLRGRIALGIRAALVLVFGGVAAYALAGHARFDAEAVNLEFPLRNGTYQVANGGNNALVNVHVQTLAGERFRDYRGQSYAVDVVKAGAWGSRTGLFPDGPEDFAIFGDPLHAPCAGTVVRARDGYPDRLPRGTPPETLEGNHVIVACGEVWVLLAHMQRGSVQVAEGERVAVGAVVGRVGNSGASDEPHLHIHAQTPGTAEAPLGGSPIPMTFDGRHLVRNDRIHGMSERHSAVDRERAPFVRVGARPVSFKPLDKPEEIER